MDDADTTKPIVLIILPTRGRPDKTEQCVKCFLETSDNAEIVVALDEDDTTLDAYKAKDFGRLDRVRVEIGPRIRMCPTVNRVLTNNPDYKYYGFIGDDHMFRTKHWDSMVIGIIENLGKGHGVVYGDDLMMHERLASAFILSKTIIEAQGNYIPHPDLIHMYMDNQVMELGRYLGNLFYIPEIVIEHMHYTQGKSEEDAQYKEVNASPIYKHDEEVFINWKEKLLPVIGETFKNTYGI